LICFFKDKKNFKIVCIDCIEYLQDYLKSYSVLNLSRKFEFYLAKPYYLLFLNLQDLKVIRLKELLIFFY
jgi:hypothetical protein